MHIGLQITQCDSQYTYTYGLYYDIQSQTDFHNIYIIYLVIDRSQNLLAQKTVQNASEFKDKTVKMTTG